MEGAGSVADGCTLSRIAEAERRKPRRRWPILTDRLQFLYPGDIPAILFVCIGGYRYSESC
ncbi:MAG: hypothetical protein HDS73_06860 [Bacteroidales bacterium]|nr:hypothetical protein [Bacteroidales bacterium]